MPFKLDIYFIFSVSAFMFIYTECTYNCERRTDDILRHIRQTHVYNNNNCRLSSDNIYPKPAENHNNLMNISFLDGFQNRKRKTFKLREQNVELASSMYHVS